VGPLLAADEGTGPAVTDALLGPVKGECEGIRDRCANKALCPLFGKLRPSKDGRQRVRGCGDPVARGRRVRRKGDDKARDVRRAQAIAGVNSRHEEHMGGAFRWEAKSGMKANVVKTAFVASEAQSEAQRPFGDHRPFIATFSPDGWSDHLVVFRGSKSVEAAIAILANHGLEVKEP
jgi:hypothetical protein